MESDGSIESLIYRNIPWAKLETTQQELIKTLQHFPQKRYLLFSEPLPTFTFGRNSKETDLLWNPSQLNEKGISVASVSRGGKWTYHGPGQILIYPIGTLTAWGFSSKGAKPFVEQLRSCIAEALQKLGLTTHSKDDPYGLFVNDYKITSFGMSFENGISSHGAALYVTPQKEFAGIVPCGFQSTPFTCLTDHLPEVSWLDAATEVLHSVKKGFKLI